MYIDFDIIVLGFSPLVSGFSPLVSGITAPIVLQHPWCSALCCFPLRADYRLGSAVPNWGSHPQSTHPRAQVLTYSHALPFASKKYKYYNGLAIFCTFYLRGQIGAPGPGQVWQRQACVGHTADAARVWRPRPRPRPRQLGSAGCGHCVSRSTSSRPHGILDFGLAFDPPPPPPRGVCAMHLATCRRARSPRYAPWWYADWHSPWRHAHRYAILI